MSKIDGTSNDALSRTLYAKRTDANSETYPVFCLTNGSLAISEVEVTPNDTTKLNPAYIITRNLAGYITAITLSKGTISLTKTITRDGSNYVTNISLWS